MPKKKNNSRLLIIFIILLALVVFLFTRKNGNKERSFNQDLTSFKTENINSIVLYPKSLKGQSIHIKKENNSWVIDANNKTYRADNRNITMMLNSLSDLKAESLVGNSKDSWKKFEVDDSLASRVQLFNNNKKMADIYFGKFSFTQPRSMSTYVRVAGHKQTYKVDGFLGGEFNRKVNDLRDKTIINDNIANWTKIKFNYPADSSFVLTNSNGKWLLNGTPADSAAVASYINSSKNRNGEKIIDVSDSTALTNLYQLTIERKNLDPIILSVKKDGNKEILQSSENKGAWFDDQYLVQQLFASKSKFEKRSKTNHVQKISRYSKMHKKSK